MPPPEKHHSFSAYVRAELFHSKGNTEWKSTHVKVKDVVPDVGADFMWNEHFEWEFEAEDLTFVRYVPILERSDLSFDVTYISRDTD